jgi:AraC-like DNA-binding protein
LLATTDYSLAEITYLVGFSEESAFIRAFRRLLACTPVDYRRSIRARRLSAPAKHPARYAHCPSTTINSAILIGKMPGNFVCYVYKSELNQ